MTVRQARQILKVNNLQWFNFYDLQDLKAQVYSDDKIYQAINRVQCFLINGK